MAVVNITEETMTAAEDKINQGAMDITSEFDAIKNIINEISEDWQDNNAEKYLEQFKELEKQVPSFVASAHRSANFLGGVVKAYREAVYDPAGRAVQGRDISSIN